MVLVIMADDLTGLAATLGCTTVLGMARQQVQDNRSNMS